MSAPSVLGGIGAAYIAYYKKGAFGKVDCFVGSPAEAPDLGERSTRKGWSQKEPISNPTDNKVLSVVCEKFPTHMDAPLQV